MTIIPSSKSSLLDIHIHQEFLEWETVDFDIEEITRKICIDVVMKMYSSFQKGEITIILANDHFIKELNKKYRKQNKPTNILSFGYGEEAFKKGMIGDLFLAFETITLEAKEQKKSFSDHYSHMIVHGILHLLGYDHEQDIEAKEMEILEIHFLSHLNIPNPYIIYERS